MRSADAALLITALVIAWSLYRAHKGKDAGFAQFNLLDLLMENGRVSKVSCLVMGAFAVHTWIMVRLTIDVKMSEGYLTIYGATWVAPMLARMFSTQSSASTATSTTTTTATATVTP